MSGNERQQHSQNRPEYALSEPERTAQYKLAQDCISHDWANNPRWKGVERPYTAADVLRLRGSIHIEHTLARLGAERLGNFSTPNPTFTRWAP